MSDKKSKNSPPPSITAAPKAEAPAPIEKAEATPAPAEQEVVMAKEETAPVPVARKAEEKVAKQEVPAAPAKPKTDNLLVRISLPVLYPPFADKIQTLVANCRARGADYWAISGERTWEEQAEIYAQGRSKPGKIVTNAKPGSSAHNFAIAVDFCFDKDTKREGLQPDWSTEKYEILAEEAKKLGLDSGFWWKKFTDAPHVQLNISSVGLTLANLREAYHSGGKKAVFRLLDKYNW